MREYQAEKRRGETMDKKETDGGILLYVKDLSIRFLDETEDKNAVCHADFYIKKAKQRLS